MELPGPHPGPPADFNSRELPLVETEQVWIRSHGATYGPRYFGRRGKNRFDAPAAEFGVLYAAADAHGAFIETFGRHVGRMIVSLEVLVAHELSEVRSTRPLRLVDITGAGLARIGADGRLATDISHSYAVSKQWSLALHEHPERPDGILFRSRHDPSRLCAAIFERAGEALQFASLGSLADAGNATLLGTVLESYRYGLID